MPNDDDDFVGGFEGLRRQYTRGRDSLEPAYDECMNLVSELSYLHTLCHPQQPSFMTVFADWVPKPRVPDGAHVAKELACFVVTRGPELHNSVTRGSTHDVAAFLAALQPGGLVRVGTEWGRCYYEAVFKAAFNIYAAAEWWTEFRPAIELARAHNKPSDGNDVDLCDLPVSAFAEALPGVDLAALPGKLRPALKGCHEDRLHMKVQWEFCRAAAALDGSGRNQVATGGAVRGAIPPAGLEHQAMALLTMHPEWTTEKIAQELRCHPKSASRWTRFKALRERLRKQPDQFHSGFLDKDGRVDGVG
jgi:hypothetical protein